MKKYTILLKAFFTCLLLISLFNNIQAQTCDRQRDSLALVALYNATDGSNWKDNTNWLQPGVSIDQWFGVSVNNLACVIKLELENNNLKDIFPLEIWELEMLEELDLNRNSLEGTIGPEIAQLTQLRKLDLSSNRFDGTIPVEIGNLSSLEVLTLASNRFSGSIPNSFGNLLEVSSLDIRRNNISGMVPNELGSLSKLEFLDFGDNKLSGPIPSFISNFSELEALDLSKNQFSGSIPSGLGELSKLRTLQLHSNLLSGEIPSVLGDLVNLFFLGLQNNQLTGEIPSEFGKLNELSSMNLASNQLTGEIPSEFSNLSSLWQIFLNDNYLSGPLPEQITGYSFPIVAFLSNNMLSGELPKELVTNNKFSFLLLNNNNFHGCFPSEYSSLCNVNVSFSDNPNLINGGDFDIFCEYGAGSCSNIHGEVLLDTIENCIKDTFEPGLNNWKIVASDGTDEYFSFTRTDGTYSLFAPPGTYNIEAIPPSPIWEVLCSTSSVVTVDSINDQNLIDFFTMFTENCPALEVDISTPLLRRCFNQTYKVQYCNYGSFPGIDSYLTVEFDDLINIDSASIPISSQIDNTLTFDLGLIPMNNCESFEIYTNVSCDAVLDQTLCVKAHIYPDTLCGSGPSQWSKASIEVIGECVNDEVIFQIKNVGGSDMVNPGSYIVIEDGVVLRDEPEQFLLKSGEIQTINLMGNGATFVLQAVQVPHHPGKSMPSAAVEGCGLNDQGEFSRGFVTQFPENDADPFIAIDCQEVVGSYDPNDKRGFPKGYGSEHFIDKGQEVNYHIRFQNTGTDTAFTVVIRDVIDPSLDLNTIVPGSSSHSYGLDIIGDTVQFVFSNIMMPDSIVNEPASHGYVQFKINHKPNTPLGQVFENTADIYFDYNDPVSTNTTYHQIGENYLVISNVQNQDFPSLEVRTSPNPFQDYTTIEMNGMDFHKGEFALFNLGGVLVKEEVFTGNKFVVERNNLSPGIYVFNISENGILAVSGKLIIK